MVERKATICLLAVASIVIATVSATSQTRALAITRVNVVDVDHERPRYSRGDRGGSVTGQDKARRAASSSADRGGATVTFTTGLYRGSGNRKDR
jgi:hypothetical protein